LDSKNAESTISKSKSALLLEDDRNLADALKLSIEKLGYMPNSFSQIHEAKTWLQNSPSWPDLCVLDRNLPDGEGLDLSKWLRDSSFEGIILILTARSQVAERVEGLEEAGADDYITKPFSWDELRARVRVLERRVSQFKANHEKWRLDPDHLEVQSPQGSVRLTALEFRLAQFLIERPEASLTRHELLKNVWGLEPSTSTRTVDLFMSRLRKRFEENPEKPRYFITVRGVGYRFDP
jgi:two-component system alkaline phosphatase synthesis response regulator PhoP